MSSLMCLLRVLLLGILAGVVACGPRATGHGEAASAVLVAGESVEPPEGMSGVSSAHLLSVDHERLLALEAGTTVSPFLQLPDGRMLDYHLTHLEGEPTRVWRGRLQGEEQARSSGLTLTRAGQRLAGGFRIDGVTYRISTLSDGSGILLNLGDEPPPPPGEPLIPEDDEGGDNRS